MLCLFSVGKLNPYHERVPGQGPPWGHPGQGPPCSPYDREARAFRMAACCFPASARQRPLTGCGIPPQPSQPSRSATAFGLKTCPSLLHKHPSSNSRHIPSPRWQPAAHRHPEALPKDAAQNLRSTTISPHCHLRTAPPAWLHDRARRVVQSPNPSSRCCFRAPPQARNAPACAATAVLARACCARTRPSRSRPAP